MFFTARIAPAPVAAGRSAAGFTATFMVIYLGATSRKLGGGRLRPSHPTSWSADQLLQSRKVTLFSLAYFSAESSISLRIIFGSFAGSQSLVTIWNLLPSHCIMWNLPAPS